MDSNQVLAQRPQTSNWRRETKNHGNWKETEDVITVWQVKLKQTLNTVMSSYFTLTRRLIIYIWFAFYSQLLLHVYEGKVKKTKFFVFLSACFQLWEFSCELWEPQMTENNDINNPKPIISQNVSSLYLFISEEACFSTCLGEWE